VFPNVFARAVDLAQGRGHGWRDGWKGLGQGIAEIGWMVDEKMNEKVSGA